jgi:hypothetical protein
VEAIRVNWTDERIDDLSNRVDDGFRRVDHRHAGPDRDAAVVAARRGTPA